MTRCLPIATGVLSTLEPVADKLRGGPSQQEPPALFKSHTSTKRQVQIPYKSGYLSVVLTG